MHPRSQSKLGRAEIETRASSLGTSWADLLWSPSGPSFDFITQL